MEHKLQQQRNNVITATNLAQAMLGLKRWLPRTTLSTEEYGRVKNHSKADDVNGVEDKDSIHTALPLAQKKEIASNDTAVTPKSIDTFSSENALSEPLKLDATTSVCGNGVLLCNTEVSVAWFMPLPWRTNNGWTAFREKGEGAFLQHALNIMSLGKVAEMINSYLSRTWSIDKLPEQNVTASMCALPPNVDTILVFYGASAQHLINQDKTEETVMLDWNGQQVSVICMPHPYSCLQQPGQKRLLWHALMKLTI